jgi:hypothetical protein
MSKALPPRPRLSWLRKTAKQSLSELRSRDPDACLADAQLQLAREYGFSSWRVLKAQIEQLSGPPEDEDRVAAFLRAVGEGDTRMVVAALAASPELVNAVGPNPFWGGRLQMLHLAIESNREDMFDLALEHGADIDGDNDGYTDWSPLMLAAYKQRRRMRDVLIQRGAHIGLHEALLIGDDARVERFLRGGVILAGRAGMSSLLFLARTPWAIDRLLELGEPADTRDYRDETPIGSFAKLGAEGLPLVWHLQQRGFRSRAQDHARLGDLAALQALYRDDPASVRDDEVLMCTQDVAVARWLLEHGASPNARTTFGSRCMALHGAAWNGNLALAKVLVEAGADIRGLDIEHRNTPSGYARVARKMTNNPDCDAVAEYLEALERDGLPAV